MFSLFRKIKSIARTRDERAPIMTGTVVIREGTKSRANWRKYAAFSINETRPGSIFSRAGESFVRGQTARNRRWDD